MELFRYFRGKKGEYLSVKLIRSKQHLWKNIEEEEFNEAVDDLIQLGYIERIENRKGGKLLEAGDDNLKQLTLPYDVVREFLVGGPKLIMMIISICPAIQQHLLTLPKVLLLPRLTSSFALSL